MIPNAIKSGAVVICPVCDGECDVLVDGIPGRCPACDGAGAMAKDDAEIAAKHIRKVQ